MSSKEIPKKLLSVGVILGIAVLACGGKGVNETDAQYMERLTSNCDPIEKIVVKSGELVGQEVNFYGYATEISGIDRPDLDLQVGDDRFFKVHSTPDIHSDYVIVSASDDTDDYGSPEGLTLAFGSGEVYGTVDGHVVIDGELAPEHLVDLVGIGCLGDPLK